MGPDRPFWLRGSARRPLAMAVLSCVVVLGPLVGCGASGDGASTSTRSPAGSPVAEQPAVTLRPLPYERRTAALPAGFPLEVPVPDGVVTRAEAQGDSAWVYQIVVTAPAGDVARWYRSAYGGANWSVTSDAVRSSGGTITFEKGAGAQSKVSIRSDTGRSSVTASVGIGEPVNQTF